MKTIPLTQGYSAIVDDADFEWLNQFKWHAVRSKSYVYAGRRLGKRMVRMHRFILNFPDSLIDHVNGNTLDYQRSNLRLCSKRENCRNRKKRYGAVFKGVSFHKQHQKWLTKITLDYKTVHIGLFPNAVLAALAYDRAAIKFHGDFARTNFLGKTEVL